jgi:5-formyltetrahydrofolate cyclo-ligase
MDDEVFTHDFVKKWGDKKKIILPVVKGDQLELKVFRGVEELVPGENFGIPEPKGELFLDEQQIELVLVPGVAFDKQNNRMGRGKAYYDQLLISLKAVKVGICFHFQHLEQVPHDDLDIKMNIVLSNKKRALS